MSSVDVDFIKAAQASACASASLLKDLQIENLRELKVKSVSLSYKKILRVRLAFMLYCHVAGRLNCDSKECCYGR